MFNIDIESFFLDDTEFESKVPLEYLSHKEKYEDAIRKACIIFRKVQELQNEGKGGMDNFRYEYNIHFHITICRLTDNNKTMVINQYFIQRDIGRTIGYRNFKRW